MNYIESLKDLLYPLGVYNMDEGAGAAEIEGLGTELDSADSEAILAEQETNIMTAMSYGLEKYEDILPYAPVRYSAEERRQTITALLRIDDASFTLEALNSTISGCGIKATVKETAEKYVVSVSFPEERGIPVNIDEIKKRIEEILPCHLDVTYQYFYATWDEVDQLGTWDEVEAKLMTFSDIEKFEAEA